MFLHPLALLGLAAAAIPALLHLLQRRLPPDLDFPPLRYLRQAERQQARRLRLRHLLLLALRTALIVAIVLAAAGPRVSARAGGAHRPTALAVILDNSPSAGAVIDGRPVFDRLRLTARMSIARTAPQDRLWLILADGVPRAGTRDALLATLDSLTPGVVRLDLTRAVERAARLVDGEPLAAREVHVLSDLQRSTLGAGSAAVPRGVRVLALAPAPTGSAAQNRGVTSARAEEGAVAVTIGGTAGAPATPVTLRISGRDAGRVLGAPGAAVSLPLPPLPAGW